MRSYRSLLVLFVGLTLLTVGCADPGAQQLEDAQAMTLSPGTTASMPLTLEEGDLEEDVGADEVNASTSVDGMEASVDDLVETDEGGLAGWITVNASDDAAEGEHTVTVSLDGEERVLPVNVEEPAEPFEQGDVPHITFTARTFGGELVLTNDRNVSNASFPESAAFQEPQQFQPLPAQLGPQSQLPGELVDALEGAGMDHSRSVQVDEVFGPEKIEETQAREETVERELSVALTMDLPAQQAQQLLPRGVEEGDEVDIPATQEGHQAPYIVEELSEQQVSLSFALEEGETFTLYEAWPDAANVTDTSGEEATIRLESDVDEGEQLAWNADWGNVTEVTSVNETQIVLRHSPSEGFTYEQTDPRSQETVETEVVEVGSEEIVVEQTNPHPMAGQPLIFDVTVVDEGAPEQPSIQR